MTEFVVKDFHNDFTNYCKKELDNYIYQFESINKIIYSLKNKLDNNYNFLVKYKVSNIIEDNINNIIKLELIQTNDEEQLFILDFNNFNKYINDNVLISNKIKVFTIYNNLPYNYYKIFLQNINIEITKLLLKGYSFPLPIIGSIYIARVPYDSTIPDWGRSNKFKENLINNNIEVKTLENKEGKNWFVDNGLNREDFILFRWRKYTSKLRNYKTYRFEPTHYRNIYDKVIDNCKINLTELFNRKDTGLFDKIIHLYKYHYDYAQKTFPFIKQSNIESDD